MSRLMVIAALAALHITPTVVLVKREDAVRRLLPDATSFTAREVHLSDADAHKLHEAVDWSPEDGVLTFYSGHRDAKVVATFVFIRVDSPHGPVEVIVVFRPDGAVRQVEVTKATVETKPWIVEALKAGLLQTYVGLPLAGTPAGADALKDKVGSMPDFMARQVDKGVERALAAYRLKL